MGEFSDYLKEKYSKKDDKNVTLDQMQSQRVQNTISSLCKKYLTEPGQVFRFEVALKDLQYVIVVIDEEPLKSMYDIMQITEIIFEARLKELAFDNDIF